MRARIVATALLPLCASNCDQPDATSAATGRIVAPETTAASALPVVPTSGATRLSEGPDVVRRADPESLAVVPVPPLPQGQLETRKNFIDPPLPAELQDDGGLVPLPRSTRSTDR